MPIGDVSHKTLQQLISLEGRAAVVTGAARGIGYAIASRLAEAGADIVIADLDRAAAEQAAASLAQKFKRRALGTVADVQDEGAVAGLADQAVRAFGHLDIWVNNAGIFPGSPTLDTSVAEWDLVQAVNLRGVFLGAREAARRMMANPVMGGVIINIASMSGLQGRAGLAAYTASKHAVVGLTKSLALEFGSSNIRVIGIAPTSTTTPGITARAAHATDEELKRIEILMQGIAQSLALGRTAVPDDIARVVLFCASDLALFMTGSTLPVDAGALAR